MAQHTTAHFGFIFSVVPPGNDTICPFRYDESHTQKHSHLQTPEVSYVRLQVLTAASTKMTAFWEIAACTLLEVDRRSNETTQRSILESCNLHQKFHPANVMVYWLIILLRVSEIPRSKQDPKCGYFG
jgi:hypothetical protein